MTQTEQLSQDLQFVRHAVAKRDGPRNTPTAILIVWAVYVLIGYTLLDFHRLAASWFFLFGGIAGGCLSAWFGRRSARREGELDRAEGIRHGLHWGSIFLGVIAVLVLAATQPALRQEQLAGQLIVLVIGIVYFLAGVHFDRRFLALGVLLLAGAIGVGMIHVYPWTILGALIGGALLVTALLNRSTSRPQHHDHA